MSPNLPEPQLDSVLSETVYAHLRAIAQRQIAGERPGHTLSATALVHEAFLRLRRPDAGPAADAAPRAFYQAAAQAMRRILIEHARGRGAAKRGGDWVRSLRSVEQLADEGGESDTVALDAAFLRLESEDPRAAEVVKLRFYAGLSIDRAAEVMGVSRRTALRDWDFARAWLLSRLSRDE